MKKQVYEICKLKSVKGDQPGVDVIGTISFEKGEIKIVGKKWFVKSIMKNGILGSCSKVYYPKDGKKFIRALPFHFKSGYNFLRKKVIE